VSGADEYGFSAAMAAGLHLFDLAGRRSGRTTRMIERAQDGDLIVCATECERRRLQRLLRDAGKPGVRVIHVGEGESPVSRLGGRRQGRAFFDHEWTRRHFVAALRNAESDLEHWQCAISEWAMCNPPRGDVVAPDSYAALFVSDFARGVKK
jgi:hypothetical protein